MYEDQNGKPLQVGDEVAVLFTVTNLIEDSHQRNLLVRHSAPMTGSPDDFRLAVDSDKVTLISRPGGPDPTIGQAEPLPGLPDPSAESTATA